jgi:hypothetical protein
MRVRKSTTFGALANEIPLRLLKNTIFPDHPAPVMNVLKKTIAAAVLAAFAAAPASAAGKRRGIESQLKLLDPGTRLEQVCDIEAMRRINRDPNSFHPDRAVLAATADPRTSGHTIEGSGGAFRSGGKWYGFSFKCAATDDHMKVIDFDYKLGGPIPEDQWAKDGLWE